jgi:hypothetical protein
MLPTRQDGTRFGVWGLLDNAADLCVLASGLTARKCRVHPRRRMIARD